MTSTKIPKNIYSLENLSNSLKKNIYTKKEIIKKLHDGLAKNTNFNTLSSYLIDLSTFKITLVYPTENPWNLPETEKQWLLESNILNSNKTSNKSNYFQWITKRSEHPNCDQKQLKEDIKKYNYNCEDGLFITLLSEEQMVLGFTFVHNWKSKAPLFNSKKEFEATIKKINFFINDVSVALENLLIHKKIEALLSDKQELTHRIKKDEETLKRRILELTTLYDTSNSLSYTLNYHQIANVITNALVKVLDFDVCAIFISGFVPEGEIITRLNKPLSAKAIKSIHHNILKATTPFIKENFDESKITTTLKKHYSSTKKNSNNSVMKSFANVPLIFKEKVIGMLNVCSTTQNAFPRNEMTFLHTMANQLASNLGRLKTIQQLEKTKIMSLIESMKDGVIMLDEYHQVSVANPAALTILEIRNTDNLKFEKLSTIFESIGLLSLYKAVIKTKKPLLNQKITYENNIYSVNLTPTVNKKACHRGIVLVFRDITELQKIDRIKTQRLNVISKVNEIINSISDLDKLLHVLMEFILNVANAEMGSIQLKENKVFFSKIHSNFPDKIRRTYKLKNGTTISEHILNIGKSCLFKDFFNNKEVAHNVKILLDCYLCIPIKVKGDIIGVINIVRKYGNPHPKITEDDVNTLSTIATLSGTAIQNALLFEEKLTKEKLAQELKVASDIQKKLLPAKLPSIPNSNFGAISIPAREIGGDYYDFFELEDNNIGIIVADIVGKGIPAGLFMAMLKSILHTHIPSFDSPQVALEIVNNVLYNDPVTDKFVPLFYGIFNFKKMTLSYCNAGHEPGVLLSNNKFSPLDTKGLPLGAWEDTKYEEKTITLKNHDLVLLATDGITEARNKKGNSFGEKKLKKTIQKHTNKNAFEIVQALYEEIKIFSKGKKQHDDLTIVALKIDLFQQKKEIEAPIKVFEMHINSEKKHIKPVRKKAKEICTKMGFNNSDAFKIQLAINEAHVNIIEHAYFGSEKGDIAIYFKIFSDRLVITLKDFGSKVSQKTIKGEKKHLKELEGSGLGVFLIKSIMDDLQYQKLAIGTELSMVKYLNKQKKGAV